MKNPKFQIYTGEGKQFYFRLCAENGEIILGSEGYVSKSGCENGIRSVQDNAANGERYERKTAEDGQHYFLLGAGNRKVIGTSETYSSGLRREDGIKPVRRTALHTPVEDILQESCI